MFLGPNLVQLQHHRRARDIAASVAPATINLAVVHNNLAVAAIAAIGIELAVVCKSM
jgi:hypothetical protein